MIHDSVTWKKMNCKCIEHRCAKGIQKKNKKKQSMVERWKKKIDASKCRVSPCATTHRSKKKKIKKKKLCKSASLWKLIRVPQNQKNQERQRFYSQVVSSRKAKVAHGGGATVGRMHLLHKSGYAALFSQKYVNQFFFKNISASNQSIQWLN